MTRTEAEHLLDAYKLTADLYGDDAVTKALKEVILDAMTSTTYYPCYISAPKPTPWPYPQVTYSTTYPTRADAEVDA